ncbi:hypothetical protein DL98DRAFT_594412 [Cadophora sp. DSE1049]|nr:hypothetical protein DL98DRAFT_594412 [Cadophora sp. DSE1049]
MTDDTSNAVNSGPVLSSSDMPAVTAISSKSGTRSIDNDYLSNLIPELLFEILFHLSTSDFLSLVQTSQRLRKLTRNNAGHICNQAIKTRYATVSALMEAKMTKGWLTLTHPSILACEEYMIKDQWLRRQLFPQRFALELNNKIRLSEPGPLYLHALEEFGDQVLAVFQYHALALDAPADTRTLWRVNLPFMMEMDRLIAEMLRVANERPRNRRLVASWRER